MNSPAINFPSQAFAKTAISAMALALLTLTGCGKKEETAPSSPPPSPAPPVVEKPAEAPVPPPPSAPAPEAAKPPVTPPPSAAPDMREPVEPKKAAEPPPPAPASATPQRSSADAAAWQLWDRAAERMRDIGATVRDSTDPRRLEVVVGSTSDAEVRAIARAAYTALGGGEVSVVLYDASGAQVGQANIEGVTGR